MSENDDPERLADAVSGLAGLALDFAATDRTHVYLKDRRTPESDTDHTVMLAWVAGSLAALLYADEMDPFLVTTHAVWHDAVEVFAGDTPTLRITDAGRAAKAGREAAAEREWARRFSRSLPWAAWRVAAYEAQDSREARFVRAVDKMMPRLVHMFDRCTGLHEAGMTAGELARGLPETTARITGRGEFPELEAVATVLAGRLAAVHAATAPTAGRTASVTAEPPRPVCGHEYVLGDVAYRCERPPHPADGYGPGFRHAAGIDAGLAEWTDEGGGDGPATLVTWGEDSQGDGQGWEIAWGTIADYGAA